jgi:hypothetical protein
MRGLALVLTLGLAGCSTPILLDNLEPPAKTLMVPPKKIPDIQNGEDVGVNNLKVRHVCSLEISKLRRLQRYVTTVTTKGEK